MSKPHSRTLSYILYAVASLAFILYFGFELNAEITMWPATRIALLCSGCACIYSASIFLSRTVTRELASTIMRRSFLVFFVIYILLLLTFTLFDDGFGRNEKNFFILTGDPFIQSVKESVNLVPFKTIKLYLRNIARDRITVGDFAINMLGNLAALAPMGFFLPLLFKKQRHWYAVAFTTSLVVAMIELLQLVFQKGSCDIDDLLLNVAGAVAAYTICWSKPVARQIDRLTHRARFTQ